VPADSLETRHWQDARHGVHPLHSRRGDDGMPEADMKGHRGWFTHALPYAQVAYMYAYYRANAPAQTPVPVPGSDGRLAARIARTVRRR
jgi:hypothetical protein